MPKLTLKAGEERAIATPKAFLNILYASAQFVIESPDIGVLTGKTNRHFEMGAYRSVFFVNNTDTAIDIDYEIANIRTTSSGESNVNVKNEVVVKRIVEGIAVNASATVENGKMSVLVSDAFLPIAANKKSITAGQTLEVLVARPALNRTVILQLITDSVEMGEIRVGSTAPNAVEGIFMQGNKDAPAQFVLETATAVFVHNPTASTVTIGGCEQWRA